MTEISKVLLKEISKPTDIFFKTILLRIMIEPESASKVSAAKPHRLDPLVAIVASKSTFQNDLSNCKLEEYFDQGSPKLKPGKR